jgi:hypothetical protein
MIVFFNTEQQRTACTSIERLVQQFGEKKARRIKQRLDELDAAQSLAHFKTLPATNCRSIDSQNGLVAVTTIPPACILIQAINESGASSWYQITTVKILELNEKIYD